jgi:WD40 repeat protein
MRTFAGHTGRVNALLVAADGSWLASAGGDSMVRVWDPVSGNLLHELSGHQRSVRALSLMRGIGLLASAGDDGSIRVWSAQNGKPTAALNVDGPIVSLRSAGPLLLAGGPRGCYHLRLEGLK